MKRIIIMLLITCSAVTTVSADPSATPQKKPENVINSLDVVINIYGQKDNQTLSITKNPNTGIIESSERITPFSCKKEDLWNIPITFMEDEPLSYQFMHLMPWNSNNQIFELKVYTDGGKEGHTVTIRTSPRQEMWLMCCKNPDNPQLRDAYAITWELSSDKTKVVGYVYMITSLRPDYYEQIMSSRTGSKLFELPQAGINEDNFSIVAHDVVVADSIEVVDDDVVVDDIVVDADTCVIDTIPGYFDIPNAAATVVPEIPQIPLPNLGKANDWRSSLTPQQMMEIQKKMMNMKWSIENVKTAYEIIPRDMDLFGFGNTSYWDETYKNIIQRNKELDKNFHELLKVLERINMPREELKEGYDAGYKEMLNIFTEQNKAFNDIYKKSGRLTKAAQKAQKYVNKLTEKYISEMGKLLYQMP